MAASVVYYVAAQWNLYNLICWTALICYCIIPLLLDHYLICKQNFLWCHSLMVLFPHLMWFGGGGGGAFKKAYEHLHLRALNFSFVYEIYLFQCVRYFVSNFKMYLWNSTQKIYPRHWKIWFVFVCSIEILRALGFKSSWVLLKCPPPADVQMQWYDDVITWKSFLHSWSFW